MRGFVLAAAAALAACQSAPKSAAPRPAAIVQVPVPTYVPVPEKLTARCAWERDVPPSKSIKAARERAACLEQYEANDDATRAIQGQPVPVE